MTVPAGWRRCEYPACDVIGRIQTEACVQWRRGDLTISADPESVYIFDGTNTMDGMKIKTTFERDGLVSVLVRAWHQHLHLKTNPLGPPLSEEDEETRIIA